MNLTFKVRGLVLGVRFGGLGFGVWGLGFTAQGSGFRVQELVLRRLGLGSSVLVQGLPHPTELRASIPPTARGCAP